MSNSSKLSQIEKLHFFIPPINTQINFTTELPYYDVNNSPLNKIDITKIPSSFSWNHIQNNDSEKIKSKKRLISKVQNQGLCGDCFVVSTLSALGDNYVVNELISWKPHLSSGFALACYGQNKCRGGNPAKLCIDIKNNGVATNTCIDDSFCKTSNSCYVDPSKTQISAIRPEEIEANIPNCGCFFSGDYYYYYLSKAEVITIPTDDTKNTTSDLVKKHIFTHGPLIAGFLVFNNFRSGNFTKINGGVYLENGVYDDENGKPLSNKDFKFDNNQTKSINYIGSHAIVIVGYGIQKNIRINNNSNELYDIPYWLCRNSWSVNWGDHGFFKIAIYPFNQIAQLDKIITVTNDDNDESTIVGGMIALKVKDPPILKNLGDIDLQFLSQKKHNDDAFYQDTNDKLKFSHVAPPKLKNETKIHDDSNKSKNQYTSVFMFGLSIVLIASLITFVLFFYIKNNNLIKKEK
jgi:hypothetical protein